jgi:hypothetical protein
MSRHPFRRRIRLDFRERRLEPERLNHMFLENGTAAPARTGDPQIHNLVL